MNTPPRTLLATLAIVTLASGCSGKAVDIAGASSTPTVSSAPVSASATPSATSASSTPAATASKRPSATPATAKVPAGYVTVTAPTQGVTFAVPQSWVVVTTRDTARVDEYAKAINKPSSSITDMLQRNDLMATATTATDAFTQNIMVPLGTLQDFSDEAVVRDIVSKQGPSATMTSFKDGPTGALGPTKLARYTIKRPTGTLAHGALGLVKVNGQVVLLITTSATESATTTAIETALSTVRPA